jgi:hypothetical protein
MAKFFRGLRLLFADLRCNGPFYRYIQCGLRHGPLWEKDFQGFEKTSLDGLLGNS